MNRRQAARDVGDAIAALKKTGAAATVVDALPEKRWNDATEFIIGTPIPTAEISILAPELVRSAAELIVQMVAEGLSTWPDDADDDFAIENVSYIRWELHKIEALLALSKRTPPTALDVMAEAVAETSER